MNILGITHDVINTSASLIINGKIVAAIAEERLTRQKKTRLFPTNAIKFCLNYSNLKFSDIDYVAHSFNPSIFLRKKNIRYSNISRWRAEYFTSIPNNLTQFIEDELYKFSYQEIGIKNSNNIKIFHVDHHLAHAANAFNISGFNKSAIISLDGRGEKNTGKLLFGSGNKIIELDEITYPHSIALFYGIFTEILGYRMDNDEWKVMALGAYATNEKLKKMYFDKLSKLISFDNKLGKFELNLNYFNFFINDEIYPYGKKLLNFLDFNELQNDRLNEKIYCLAYAVQKIAEKTAFFLMNHLHKKTKSNNICCSGGFFMNSLLNGKISSKTNFKKVFISSCPDDLGNSIGSALYLYNNILHKKNKYKQNHNYYGPSYDNIKVHSYLKKTNARYNYTREPYKLAAKLIYEGKIVGWFQGREEFGERALGNRSILANPTHNNMKDKINSAIKFRESFRPFAPVIIEDYLNDYFISKNEKTVKFMEKVLKIKKSKQKKICAVTHVDGTGRVQTINQKDNPHLYKVVNYFYKLSDVPVVLNTSFNLNEEPIVSSPLDALKTFYVSKIDALIIGNYYIQK